MVYGLAIASLAVVTLSVTLVGRAESPGGYRVIAVPVSVVKSDVDAALALYGIDGSIGSGDVTVPLSDFAGVIPVTLDEAAARVGTDDPRRTPYLDDLLSSFSLERNGRAWRALLIPGTGRASDRAVADAMSSLGVEWAWDAPSETDDRLVRVILMLAWSVWLALRKRGTDRLLRLLVAACVLPMAVVPGLAGTMAALMMQSLFTMVYEHIGLAPSIAGRPRTSKGGFPAAAWAMAAGVAILLVMAPPFIATFVASAALFVVVMACRGRLRLPRTTLHEPPAFVDITAARRHDEARRLAARSLASVMAAVVVVVASTLAAGTTASDGGRLAWNAIISPSQARADHAAHVAYQISLTYGRLGDATWGASAFTAPFGYREEDGRLVRVEHDAPPEPRVGEAADGRLPALDLVGKAGLGTVVPADGSGARGSLVAEDAFIYIIALAPVLGVLVVGVPRRRTRHNVSKTVRRTA